ncbi:5'-nucleotidase domain-containing protein 3 [Ilyodon furcidens]
MSYIVGKDWRDLFDVVIVQADKPSFFNDRRKPFRRVTNKGALLWDRIHRLEKGQIYKQGNLYEFLRLTGWRGSKVLYFGDHIYSDLAVSSVPTYLQQIAHFNCAKCCLEFEQRGVLFYHREACLPLS